MACIGWGYKSQDEEDKIDLLTEFQQNCFDDTKKKVVEWLTSIQDLILKLKMLKHEITDDFSTMHILASLPKEYDDLARCQDYKKERWFGPQAADDTFEGEIPTLEKVKWLG